MCFPLPTLHYQSIDFFFTVYCASIILVLYFPENEFFCHSTSRLRIIMARMFLAGHLILILHLIKESLILHLLVQMYSISGRIPFARLIFCLKHAMDLFGPTLRSYLVRNFFGRIDQLEPHTLAGLAFI